MNNFLRVFRLALKYRLSVIGIYVCSLMVALLWGANISAVYPFMGIFFENESIPVWVDRRIEEGESQTADLQASIAELRKQLATTDEQDERRDLFNQIKASQHRLQSEVRLIHYARRAQPYVHRYLPRDTFATLLIIVGFLVVCTLLKCGFLVGSSILGAHLGERITLELRRTFFRRLIEMDMPTFQEQRTGKLISRTTNEIGKVVQGITTLLGQSFREPMKMVVCLIGAAVISWRLLLLTLVVTPLAALLMTRLGRLLRNANLQLMRDREELVNRLAQALTGFATVKAFGTEGRERARFHHSCRDMYRRSMRISWLNSLISPNNELLGISIIGLAILAGGYLVLNQQTHLAGLRITNQPLTPAGLLAFYAFVVGVADPIRKLSGVYGKLQGTSAAADRLYEVLDRRPVVQNPVRPRVLNDPRGEVAFERVSFQYQDGTPVLQDISFRIPPGETLAIVGPNGCGKSTLASLVLRFYDPTAGSVRLDDVDLRELRQRDWRRHIGVVSQQTWLFDDTVLNNIRYGTAGASVEQAIQAAKQSHAHEFIVNELPDGYESHVGEGGSQLSGGQRQRVALARAMLRNPSILILDEATSQIDPESEALIHQSLRHFIQGRTTIMITHRLSTLALANRILVMDAGRIVGLGTHTELIAECGLYQRLCQSGLKSAA